MIFISLGIDCGPATILNKLQLRNCSFPFDWTVTYEGVTNIIKNNFNNYFPEIYNNKYQKLNNANGILFLHNQFPNDIEQMKNRIVKFKNILEFSNEKIIFIRKSHGEHHHKEYNNIINDIDDTINLDILFKEKYPNLIYEIHLFLICGDCFVNVKYENSSSNIKIYNISRPYPTNINVTNPEYFDELCKNLYSDN
jgi:hypothetical protein